MAVTKTKRTLIAAATSNAAGATTSGAEVNLSTALGGVLTVRITNGGTGPTVAASVVVFVGGSTGEKRELARLQSNTGNSVVTDLTCEVPQGVMFLNVDVTGNTGQAVTAEVFLQELTSL